MGHRRLKYDIGGQRFGKWTVKRYVKECKWVCVCDCGYETVVNTRSLRSGRSKQCWKCGRKHKGNTRVMDFGEASFNEVYRQYKRNARVRGLSWEIEPSLAKLFFRLPCVYCGSPPSNQKNRPHSKGGFIYSGIDRFDSKIGYVSTNCVPCCKLCNWMKTDLSNKDFMAHINKISTMNREFPCL